ncbi:helix-turn-helix transcriptional regulator [Kineococcus sp. G2]|uniref:helix-turn-helix transcriptional regulator n=1 Tax=Kineococcus sp. G2 TaxID=3127484 RepID=UPI00301D79CB
MDGRERAEAHTGARTQVHAALASPVRRRLLELLRAAEDPVPVHELADRLQLHVTTARFHLGHLERAGLVTRHVEPAGRGRPPVRYRAVQRGPGEQGDGDVRERMIDALAEALAEPGAGTAGPDRALEAGRRWAEQVALPPGGPVAALTGVFGDLGFAPEVGADGIALHACPFRSAARRQPQVVCRVHLGLAQRLAERAAGPDGPDGPGVALAPFAGPDLCVLRPGAAPA